MHNSLVFESVSAYIYWELFEWTPKGLVRFTWQDGLYYIINPVYYAFKHYAYFTDPGWRRVEASTDSGSLGDLRISAFKNPENDQLTVVIINKSGNSFSLKLTLNGFSPTSSEVYRSTSALYWSDISPFDPSMSLPGQSITTIHLTGTSSSVFTDCDKVLTAGYGLTSDISGDCYVNYEDFATIADYWLSSDCFWLNNYCDGADLKPMDGDVDFSDLGTFVQQWLWCNDPNDPGCVHNW
jgi:hypothetical protein